MNLTLSEIARVLGGDISNGSVLAPGPNNKSKSDRSMSVSLSSSAPDGFVVHSFSPKNSEIECKDHVRRRLGLGEFKPGSNRPINLESKGTSIRVAPPSKQSINKTIFSFISPETGETLYKKTRVDFDDGSKTFYFEPKQRGGSEPLLYGGERVKAALDNGQTPTVCVVEGEKKVDKLRELGVIAVSGDSGANSKWSAAHGKLLAHCNIVLWPDSDGAGDKYISEAAKAIQDARVNSCVSGVYIKIVRPFPAAHQGEKGRDVCDWRGGPEELKALFDNADNYGYGHAQNKFKLERFEEITFTAKEEWLVKRVLPRIGVAAIYGKPGSFKSFVAADIAFNVALGHDWAGRRVMPGSVVYIAAEGSSGFRKRKVGFERAHGKLPANVPFHLISSAPNLGMENGDLPELVSAIEAGAIAPSLIVIDTLAQTLNSADENGAGMVQFVANAGAIASRFKCLVLVVHHCGLSEEKRMRGHSSLNGAMDAVILCERREGELTANLTLQKLKDEVSDVHLSASLSRVVVGTDEDGDEISTLVVDGVEDAAPAAAVNKPRRPSPTQRLLYDVVAQVTSERGEKFRPWADGPEIKAAPEDVIRKAYYEREAVQDDPNADPATAADNRRNRFNRARIAMVNSKVLIAAKKNGLSYLWIPDSDADGRTGLIDSRPRPSDRPETLASDEIGRKSEIVRNRPASELSPSVQNPGHSFTDEEIVEVDI